MGPGLIPKDLDAGCLAFGGQLPDQGVQRVLAHSVWAPQRATDQGHVLQQKIQSAIARVSQQRKTLNTEQPCGIHIDLHRQQPLLRRDVFQGSQGVEMSGAVNERV